jgi:hypothetical protein
VEVTWPRPDGSSALERESGAGGGEMVGSTWILRVRAGGGSDMAGSRWPLRAQVGEWEVGGAPGGDVAGSPDLEWWWWWGGDVAGSRRWCREVECAGKW